MKSGMKGESTQQVTLRFSNSSNKEVIFVLEPWGETYPFAPGEDLLLRAEGPFGGSPEVDLSDDAITVWGWTGSTARLFRNGEELGAGLFERTPVPKFPPSVKQS